MLCFDIPVIRNNSVYTLLTLLNDKVHKIKQKLTLELNGAFIYASSYPRTAPNFKTYRAVNLLNDCNFTLKSDSLKQ